MTLSKQILFILAGLVLIAVGIYLMFDFILQFLQFIIGLVLFGIGVGFLMRKR